MQNEKEEVEFQEVFSVVEDMEVVMDAISPMGWSWPYYRHVKRFCESAYR